MKLTCPRCHAKSSLPDERVPASGAWAKCPKCQERFFIKPQPEGARPGERTPAKPGPADQAPPGRSEAAQKLLDRLRSRQGAETAATSTEGPPFEPDTVFVFPEPETDYRPYIVVLGLLTAGLVALAANIIGSAWSRPAPPPPAPVAWVVPAYGEEGLRADLGNLRRDFGRRNRLDRRVTWSGAESRVFKYFLARLAPDMCQEITSLRLRSDRPFVGFTAIADCLEPNRDSPEFSLRWEGEAAVVTRPGHMDRMMVTLSPGAGTAPTEPGNNEDSASPMEELEAE